MRAKYYICFLFVILFFLNSTTSSNAGGPDDHSLLKAEGIIRKNNPQVTDTILNKDRKVIKNTYQDISKVLTSKGFVEEDINQAVVTSWMGIRGPEKSLGVINGSMFIKTTLSLGKIQIESVPVGASIYIDGIKQDEKTNASMWFEPKNYRFKLLKDGYLPEEEVRAVAEGKNAPLSKTLKPLPKKPPRRRMTSSPARAGDFF